MVFNILDSSSFLRLRESISCLRCPLPLDLSLSQQRKWEMCTAYAIIKLHCWGLFSFKVIHAMINVVVAAAGASNKIATDKLFLCSYYCP
uniref:Uncharacterized protein n=1 Tax=Octopus bimaculoides TaxID=37653 RepID=A0A0L8G683_OCTBM